MSLDGHALGRHVRIGTQIESSIGREDDGLQQLVETGALLGGDVDEHGLAAVLLRHQTVLGELTTHPVRIGLGLVDLVDGHHDRHIGRLGMVECLNCLGHDAIIGRDHQHRDVGGLGTAGTHGRERLVTRGVDEGDGTGLTVHLGVHLVGTNGLGDTASLTLHHMGVAEGIEQLGLAVVDVAHDGDDRRTCCKVLLAADVLTELEVEGLEQLTILVLRGDDDDVVVELGAQDLKGLIGHRLSGRHHLAEVEQHLHQLCGIGVDLLGKVGQRGTTTQAHRLAITLADTHTANQRCLDLVELLPALLARLATATGIATSAGALRTTTTTAATHGTATETAAEATWTRATAATTATTATAGGILAELFGLMLGHHGRVGARHARAATGAWHPISTRPRSTATGSGTALPTVGTVPLLTHSLAGGERVVARARSTGAPSAALGVPTGTGASVGGTRTGLGPGASCR